PATLSLAAVLGGAGLLDPDLPNEYVPDRLADDVRVVRAVAVVLQHHRSGQSLDHVRARLPHRPEDAEVLALVAHDLELDRALALGRDGLENLRCAHGARAYRPNRSGVALPDAAAASHVAERAGQERVAGDRRSAHGEHGRAVGSLEHHELALDSLGAFVVVHGVL